MFFILYSKLCSILGYRTYNHILFLVGWNFHCDSDFLPLQQNSVVSSNTNLALYGQGLLQLTGDGDAIKGQRLSLSLFYNVTVSNYLYQGFCCFYIF